MGACKETGDIAGANFQEYVPFPISQDAGERTADLICNPGKRKCPQSGSEKWRRAGGQTGRQYGQILLNKPILKIRKSTITVSA